MGTVFEKFTAVIKLIAPAVQKADQLEVTWVKSLIKQGKLSWLTDQDASSKSNMGKDALAVLAHAQTCVKFGKDLENDRHWTWDDDAVGKLENVDMLPEPQVEFFHEAVSLAGVPLELAAELGYNLQESLDRFGVAAGKVLDRMECVGKANLDLIGPLLTKYGPIIPTSGAQNWDTDLLKQLLDGDQPEKDMQTLHEGSSPATCASKHVLCNSV